MSYFLISSTHHQLALLVSLLCFALLCFVLLCLTLACLLGLVSWMPTLFLSLICSTLRIAVWPEPLISLFGTDIPPKWRFPRPRSPLPLPPVTLLKYY